MDEKDKEKTENIKTDKGIESKNIEEIEVKKESEELKENPIKETEFEPRETLRKPYYKDINNEYDGYSGASKPASLGDYKYAIFKLFVVCLVAYCFTQIIQGKILDSKVQNDIYGLWEDSNGNYYEIYDNTFEMNAGSSDKTFYVGKINNVVELLDGYKIIISGVKYDLSTGTPVKEKNLDINLEITKFKKDLKEVMTGNLGTNDFDIVKLSQDTKETRVPIAEKETIENVTTEIQSESFGG